MQLHVGLGHPFVLPLPQHHDRRRNIRALEREIASIQEVISEEGTTAHANENSSSQIIVSRVVLLHMILKIKK